MVQSVSLLVFILMSCPLPLAYPLLPSSSEAQKDIPFILPILPWRYSSFMAEEGRRADICALEDHLLATEPAHSNIKESVKLTSEHRISQQL